MTHTAMSLPSLDRYVSRGGMSLRICTRSPRLSHYRLRERDLVTAIPDFEVHHWVHLNYPAPRDAPGINPHISHYAPGTKRLNGFPFLATGVFVSAQSLDAP